MKQIVIISGKGGTGKTSIVASFAALAKDKVLVDCDVDAADLHLILDPGIISRQDFQGGKRARIVEEACSGCGECEELCRFDAVFEKESTNGKKSKVYKIDPIACEGCGVCAYFCPEEAVKLEEVVNGEWFISNTRHGPMIHARLGIAEENSGKLVTIVRRQAVLTAEKNDLSLIIIDGSPGIGCPVIASLTGTDLAIVVTEPTLSGEHDLMRVADLTAHFKIPTAVCINKYDINIGMTAYIEAMAKERGLKVLGSVRYDDAVTKAQIMKASVVEYTGGAVSEDIKSLWRHVVYELG